MSDEPATGAPNPLDRVGLVTTMHVHMERKLNENSHKGGWDGLSKAWLLNRLRQEVGELERALSNPKSTAFDVWGEAADVANFAGMLADVHEARSDAPEG